MAESCVDCSITVHQGKCANHLVKFTYCSVEIKPVVLDLSTPLNFILYSDVIDVDDGDKNNNNNNNNNNGGKKGEGGEENFISSSPSSNNLFSFVQSVSELFNNFIADFISPEKSIQEIFGTICLFFLFSPFFFFIIF